MGGETSNWRKLSHKGRNLTKRFGISIEVLVTSAECEVEAISVRGRPHIDGFALEFCV